MRSRLTTALVGMVLSISLVLPASAEVLIAVDKDAQRMTVMVDGQPRYAWPVSTGAGRYDTPSGAHRPSRMERTHFSREFDDAPMPNAIFFTGQGHAIHGTNHTRQLGSPASHGCVRLSPKNAATLFSLVKAQGMANTRVVIDGSSSVVAGGRKRRDEDEGFMSAGMQMGRESSGRAYNPYPARRVYRQSDRDGVPYGYGGGYGWGDGLIDPASGRCRTNGRAVYRRSISDPMPPAQTWHNRYPLSRSNC